MIVLFPGELNSSRSFWSIAAVAVVIPDDACMQTLVRAVWSSLPVSLPCKAADSVMQR